MGLKDGPPFLPEVGTKLTSAQPKGTPVEGKGSIFVGSTNKWILFFDGMILPQGVIRTTACAGLMDNLGVGYQL